MSSLPPSKRGWYQSLSMFLFSLYDMLVLRYIHAMGFFTGMEPYSKPTYWGAHVWWFQVLKLQSWCWSQRLLSLSLHFRLAKRGCWGNKQFSFTKVTTMPSWGSLFSEPSCQEPSKTSSLTSTPSPPRPCSPGKAGRSILSKKWRQ